MANSTMKNDFESEEKKDQKSICITSRRQCDTSRPIERFFFTNLGMGRCPRSVASRQISRLWLLKCGLPGVKIAKIAHFWYNFAKNGLYPLNQFLPNLALGGSPTFAPSRQILPFWLSKCGLTAQKIAKNGNFQYKFSSKAYIPLSHFFTKFGLGEGAPRPHPHAKFHRCSFKMWPYGSKNRQKWYFLVKICPSGKILGVDRKT